MLNTLSTETPSALVHRPDQQSGVHAPVRGQGTSKAAGRGARRSEGLRDASVEAINLRSRKDKARISGPVLNLQGHDRSPGKPLSLCDEV